MLHALAPKREICARGAAAVSGVLVLNGGARDFVAKAVRGGGTVAGSSEVERAARSGAFQVIAGAQLLGGGPPLCTLLGSYRSGCRSGGDEYDDDDDEYDDDEYDGKAESEVSPWAGYCPLPLPLPSPSLPPPLLLLPPSLLLPPI